VNQIFSIMTSPNISLPLEDIAFGEPDEGLKAKGKSWLSLPWRSIAYTTVRIWQITCLLVLLAVAATIPIIQWASLGYLLEAASRVANGRPRREILPGLERAGRIILVLLCLVITWLPVWLATQYSYQAELIEPSSRIASLWRTAAGTAAILWMIYGLWAIIRGGRIRDFLWPAPVRFFKEFIPRILRRSTWHDLEDRLWRVTVGLQVPRLAWLGFRAWLGALIWLAGPATMMVIGMQSYQQPLRVVVGVIGFIAMWWVLLHLPFLQVQMAQENRLRSMFRLSTVRQSFRKAPWAFFLGSLVTLTLALPLYLLRIEVIPKELMFLPCLAFVLLTLPAKLCVGWAMYRGQQDKPNRWLMNRYAAWFLQLAIVPIYMLFLYLGSISSWDGPLVVFLQHAFLTPVPFFGQ
jgi:hypothetical protein